MKLDDLDKQRFFKQFINCWNKSAMYDYEFPIEDWTGFIFRKGNILPQKYIERGWTVGEDIWTAATEVLDE